MTEKIVEKQNQMAAAEFFGVKGGIAVCHSLPAEDKIGIARAMGDADYNLRDYFKENKGAVLYLQHYLAHKVEVVTDSGEAVDAVRLVLIDEDGKRYSTVANGARSSFANLIAIFGMPPFNPPIKIEAREIKTRRGFYTLNLSPLE